MARFFPSPLLLQRTRADSPPPEPGCGLLLLYRLSLHHRRARLSPGPRPVAEYHRRARLWSLAASSISTSYRRDLGSASQTNRKKRCRTCSAMASTRTLALARGKAKPVAFFRACEPQGRPTGGNRITPLLSSPAWQI